MNDVVGAVEKVDVSCRNIAELVLAPHPAERRPRPDVIPAEIAGYDHDFAAALEDADVDRDRHYDAREELWGIAVSAVAQSGCEFRGVLVHLIQKITGTKDQVMPIDQTGRDVARRLKALGYDVTYREFDGGHTVPEPVTREAFEWFRQ